MFYVKQSLKSLDNCYTQVQKILLLVRMSIVLTGTLLEECITTKMFIEQQKGIIESQ